MGQPQVSKQTAWQEGQTSFLVFNARIPQTQTRNHRHIIVFNPTRAGFFLEFNPTQSVPKLDFFFSFSLQWRKILESKLVTLIKFYGENFDMYCGVSASK